MLTLVIEDSVPSLYPGKPQFSPTKFSLSDIDLIYAKTSKQVSSLS